MRGLRALSFRVSPQTKNLVYGLIMVGRSDEISIPGVTFVAPNFGPCIVCGHPTGDCNEEDHSIIFKDEEDDNSVLVEEDIIERRWVTPNHLGKVLVVPAGTRISRSDAENFGLI